MLIRLTAVLALAALITGCAHAGPPAPLAVAGPEPIQAAPLADTGILAELPANAPAGECYARVGVPEAQVAPPPAVAQATWVQSAGPPGSPGPIWCLVPVCAQCMSAPPIPDIPVRYGWIRVICEKDLTPDRIRRVQGELHQRGFYQGPVSGQYDDGTAQAVTLFQEQAHIEHGGYLSLQTVDALDARGGVTYGGPVQAQPYPYAAAPAAPPVYAQSPAYQAPVYAQAPAYPAPVYQAPAYPQVAYGYQQPAYPQPQPYPQIAYAQPPIYAQAPVYAQAPAYPQPVYPQGYPQAGYPQAGYPPVAYGAPPQAYPQQAYGGASAYASAEAYAGAGGGIPEPAYRRASAVQGGWLTWPGKQAF